MCGIYGSVGLNRSGYAGQAVALLKHRGPDDDGHWADEFVMLAHTRLAIIDTSLHGHQPMRSDDGRYVIVFNGEIYNHQVFRSELMDKGVIFRGTSDTETLLNSLMYWGEEVISRLNGIFAFAFYDTLKQRVVVARDHLGVKPLYFKPTDASFQFASEAKLLIDRETTADTLHLLDYLTLLWSPGENTAATAIKKLLPGHYCVVEKSGLAQSLRVTTVKYYEIPFSGAYKFNAEKETVDILDNTLQDVVSRQLLADVPVGFFLSGGLDSSLLVALARRVTDARLPCFTVADNQELTREGFSSDYQFATKVARHLDVALMEVPSTVDIVKEFDRMIWHLDEPQADAAPLHVYNISKEARQRGIKVLISGTGGDDIFSGYRRHQLLRLEGILQYVPSFVGMVLGKVPLTVANPYARKLKKVVNELGKTPVDRLSHYFTWIDRNYAVNLFRPEYRSAIQNYFPTAYFYNLLQNIPQEKSWLNRMLYWEMKSFLVDHNLNYTDKLGMAQGVEIRVPYLDVELVNLACSIHPDLKLKGLTTKYVLKKVAERYLPKDVIYRPKTGFGAPVRKWIVEDLRELITDRLLVNESAFHSIFQKSQVKELITANAAGKVDASYTIWALLAIESWMRQFNVKATVGSHITRIAS